MERENFADREYCEGEIVFSGPIFFLFPFCVNKLFDFNIKCIILSLLAKLCYLVHCEIPSRVEKTAMVLL